MRIGIDDERGVAFHQIAGGTIQPGVPKTRQAPELGIGTLEASPHVASAFPVGFVKGQGRDDAALTTFPGPL